MQDVTVVHNLTVCPHAAVEPPTSPTLQKQEAKTEQAGFSFDSEPVNLNNPNDPLNPENRKKAAMRSKIMQKKLKKR